MSIKEFLFGKPTRFEQLPTVTPEQHTLLNQLLGGIGSPLGMGIQNLQQILSGSPEAFKAFEAPARSAFMQQTVPQIAERFSGLGAQRSSAFGQTLGQAGAGLEENLAAQRAQLQSQALGQLQNLLATGMTPQFTTTQLPGGPGVVQGLLSLLGQTAGTVGSQALGAGLTGMMTPGVRGFKGGLRALM